MPQDGSLDPAALQRSFENLNEPYKGLTWELEDLVNAEFMELFLSEHPSALVREVSVFDSVHRELTRDGKSQLVRFCKDHSELQDLERIVEVLHALRHYLNLPALK